MKESKVNVIFNNIYKNIVLTVKSDTTIKELINEYYERMEKGNLIDENIEKTYFIYNCESINYKDNNETVGTYFKKTNGIEIYVCRLEYNKNYRDYKKTRTIKDNIYTCVEEAKVKNEEKLVAIKKIKKERLKKI